MKFSKDEMVQRDHFFSIVDEIDSCLIDEARTPLVISGASEDKTNQYLAIDKLIKQLKKEDYEIDEKDKNILLTNEGINNVEKIFSNVGLLKNNNFYDPENLNLVHFVNQALRANHLFQAARFPTPSTLDQPRKQQRTVIPKLRHCNRSAEQASHRTAR